MDATAIIPSWNGRHLLETLVCSLRQQTRPFVRILVIDNGSTDDTICYCREQKIEVLALEENRGFAYAVNRGIEECRTPLLAVLNNDVRLAPDWLATLTASVAPSAVWFAAGKLLDAANPDIVDGTFDLISRAACAWRCGAGQQDGAPWNECRTVSMPPFTATLFKTETFRSVGLLDERFESYLEDVDFGVRAGSNGYTGRYVPKALAWHAGSATLGRWHARSVRQIARNQVWLVAKHYSPAMLGAYGWQIALGQLLWGAIALRHGAGLAYLRGKFEGVRGFRAMRSKHLFSNKQFLESSEQELHQLQKQIGFDLYWRLYFALT